MPLSTIVSSMQDYKDKETNVIIYFAKSYQLIFFTNFTGQQNIKQTSYFQRQNNFFWNVPASRSGVIVPERERTMHGVFLVFRTKTVNEKFSPSSFFFYYIKIAKNVANFPNFVVFVQMYFVVLVQMYFVSKSTKM